MGVAWGVGPGFGWDVGDLIGIWEIGLGFGRFGCDFEDLAGILEILLGCWRFGWDFGIWGGISAN